MDEEYDVIVLGTGFKECLLGGLLSTDKKKVLQLDSNSFYGGEGASLNLSQLYKKFLPSDDGSEPVIPTELGLSQKYAVDLCPKFVMASGSLIQILRHTGAHQLLDFRSIQGCYVLTTKSTKNGDTKKILKVPSSAKDAGASKLLSTAQKLKYKKFLVFVEGYDALDKSTHKGHDLDKITAEDLYKIFDLDDSAKHLTGRCIAMQTTDSYLSEPARAFVERIKLYAYSTVRYGKSPFIYPLWGTGGLPEAFSRTCAINGGVFMLNTPIKEIVYADDGKVTGVTVKDFETGDDKTINCKMVVGDPSYFIETDKVTNVDKVARAVLILDHKIDGVDGDSAHIVIPASDCERKSDIYISCVSDKHMVCPQGKVIAVCSAIAEGDADTTVEAELEAAFELIGESLVQMCWFTDMLAPSDDHNGTETGCHITSSLGATADFGAATDEVLKLYAEINDGKELDMTPVEEKKDDS